MGALAADPQHGHPTLDTFRLTPTRQFYRAHYAAVPAIEPSGWRLRVDGLVERPLELDLETIYALPSREEARTLVSMGNPPGGDLVGTALWRGVELDVLAGMVGPLPNATHVRLYGADGYDTSVEVGRLGLGNARFKALLAYEINGEPLPPDLGFPLRILVPGLYGSKSVAWLTRIEFTDKPRRGYWERLGWSDRAVVKTFSKITSPPHWSVVQGSMIVQGIAFAGDRKVTAVELSVDGGPWRAAHLIPGPSPLAWTQWYIRWVPPGPGEHVLAVRATDETGFTQSEPALSRLGGTYPDGTSLIHAVTVITR